MPKRPIGFESLIKILVLNRPPKPHQNCEFYRHYEYRVTEWKDMRILVLLLMLIFFVILILGFTPITKEPQIPLITAFLGFVAGVLSFCAIRWHRHESIFRFIVERCHTLLVKLQNKEAVEDFVKDTIAMIQEERIK